MLLQSDDPYGTPTGLSAVQSGDAGFLHLLPALPSALPTGKVSGLLARGGFDVSLDWQNGKLVKAAIRARQSKPLKIRYAGREIEIQARAGQTYNLSADLKVR
jgi:alpha-L-fucosidase 2